MKKRKHVDVFGYTSKEFEGWWERSVKKILKRVQKRGYEREMTHLQRSPRKLSRHHPREMERT